MPFVRPFLPFLLSAAACGAANDGRSIPDAGGPSFGRLSLLLGANGEISAGGQLVRYRNLDAERARVLAGVGDLAASGCALVDDEARLDEALDDTPPEAVVQLLDAGELTVRVAGETVRMQPRYVPDLVPFVTGVTYRGDLPGHDGEPTDAQITAAGGEQVGQFTARAAVPPAPRIIGIARIGNGLEVTWSALMRGSVTIAVGSLRCRVPDTGRFVVPVAQADSVAVERAARTPFRARGLDTAEVVVTVRDARDVTSF
jgi:hypothetical protein